MNTTQVVPTERPRGTLIALMGIPGSGKSSAARAMGQLIPDARVYNEPEEELWPAAVADQRRTGDFTALSWFRSARVPLLFSAHDDRTNGRIAIVDSYYDKLISMYIEHDRMQWLIAKTDPYFSVAQLLAKIDWMLLPNADCIVFLKIAFDNWKHLLRCRNRRLDADELFLQSYETQDVFISAAQRFAEHHSVPLLMIDQAIGSALMTATRIVESLNTRNVLHTPAR